MRTDTKLLIASLLGGLLAAASAIGSLFVPSALHVGFLLTIALVVFALSAVIGATGVLWYVAHTAMASATSTARMKQIQLRAWVEDVEADNPVLQRAQLSRALAATDPRSAERQTADQVEAVHSQYVEGDLDEATFEDELTELLVDSDVEPETRERVFEELR